MSKYLSQELIISVAPEPSQTASSLSIKGPLENISNLADVINLVVKLVYPLAGILLFVYFVWGGFSFITSAGDPEKVQSGKNRIKSALIGFVLLFLSYFFVGLVARILGIGEGIL